MATYEYNPKLVGVRVISSELGTHTVRGFSDGSMVVAARNNDAASIASSADDEVQTFNVNPKTDGTITMSLEESSSSNDFLTSIEGKYVAIEVKDGSGTEEAGCTFARVMRLPNVDKGSEAGSREWGFVCANLRLKPTGGKQLTP